MFILPTLLAILLTFGVLSAPSLARQDTETETADALESSEGVDPSAVRDAATSEVLWASDVKRDASNDVDKSTWCVQGGCSAFIGMIGGGAGAFLASQVGFNQDVEMVVFGVIAPITAIGIARYWAYNTPDHPPPERLLGKSPRYIQVYTDAYKAEIRSHRFLWAMAGILGVTAVGAGSVGIVWANP